MLKATGVVLALAAVVGGARVAVATNVAMDVQAVGFESSAVTVGPGCALSYRVLAELDDVANQGLAAVTFDLEFSGGALAPGDVPTVMPMAAFAPPNGTSNPDGYGGTPLDGALLQVGGAQNTVLHGQWSCVTDDDCPGQATCDTGVCTAIAGLPVGTVIPDVGYPGSPVAVVTGSLIAPPAPGVYDLDVASPRASVLELGATGRGYWPTVEAGLGSVTGLSITVQQGASCDPGPGACCLGSGLCSSVLPGECIDVLGGTTLGSGSLCEGDMDGDGADGACGDGCPDDPFKTDPGMCGCGVVDSDVDSDGDTVPDCLDQCPGADDLIDTNNDGIPDCLGLVAPIPTVSGWGLKVFALLLAACAVLIISRRRLWMH